MRKMSSFAWILILLSTFNFFTSFAHHDSEMLRSKDFMISSEAISFDDQEKNDSEHARKLTAPSEISLTGRGQKGKGAYGGANVVHRRPGSGAVMYTPCSFFIYSAINLTFTALYLFVIVLL